MNIVHKSIRWSIIAILCFGLILLTLPAFGQDDDVRPEIGISFGPHGDIGVVINGVHPDSPADEAGLQPGDIIVSIEGEFVRFGSLPELLSNYRPGDEVELSILRSDEALEIMVTLGTAPEREDFEFEIYPVRGDTTLGIRVDADQSEALIVVEVIEDGPADEAGIQVDDVIVFVDGKRVQSIWALRSILAEYDPGDEVTLIIDRDGRAETIMVALGESKQVTMQSPQYPHLIGDRPFIGVSLGNNDDRPIIMRVMPGSPADKAGIKAGEIIFMFDGEEIETVTQLIELVQQYSPGDEVAIVLQGGDESRLIFVTLGGR